MKVYTYRQGERTEKLLHYSLIIHRFIYHHDIRRCDFENKLFIFIVKGISISISVKICIASCRYMVENVCLGLKIFSSFLIFRFFFHFFLILRKHKSTHIFFFFALKLLLTEIILPSQLDVDILGTLVLMSLIFFIIFKKGILQKENVFSSHV